MPPELLPLFSPPSPRLRLSHSSADYPLWWVCSTFLYAGSVWHLQGPHQTMKFVEDVEGVYCFHWASHLHEFIKWHASLESFGNEGTEYTRWMQKPQLTIFWVAVSADLAARRQIPAAQSSKSYHMRPTLSRFRLYSPSGVNIRSRRPDWLVHR